MKTPIAFAFVLVLAIEVCAQPQLRTGDLLFTIVSDTTAVNLSSAIVKATAGNAQPQIDHVAIAIRKRGKWHVVEATTRQGVHTCPLDSFLAHADHNQDGQPLVIVGRVADEQRLDRRASLRHAKAFIGKHYDEVYSPTDDDIYCSELVQKSFVNHKGQLIFTPISMSFHDSDGQILPYWASFYSSRGLSVPEGEPGSNPSALAHHPAVHIIGRFY